MIVKLHSPRLPAVSSASHVITLAPFVYTMEAGLDGLQVTATFDPSLSTAVGITHNALEGTDTVISPWHSTVGGSSSVWRERTNWYYKRLHTLTLPLTLVCPEIFSNIYLFAVSKTDGPFCKKQRWRTEHHVKRTWPCATIDCAVNKAKIKIIQKWSQWRLERAFQQVTLKCVPCSPNY